MEQNTLGKKLLAEFIGSGLLVMAIVSSAILAYEVLGASVGLSVLYIGIATGLWLFVLVEVFGPISGAHFNPAVTVAMMVSKDIDAKTGGLYIPVQIAGGIVGVVFTHMMFLHLGFPLMTISTVARPAWCYWAEFVGTFVLLMTIYGCVRGGSKLTSLAVGLVVGGGILTTSATMFVNPQVTIARMFTYAIAGVRPLDAGPFIVCELLGALAAAGVFGYLYPKLKKPKE
jgi:glycerol uptake facilitator-like aquaporin